MSRFEGWLIKLISYKNKKSTIPLNKNLKILVITYDAIGDMVLTTPVFKAIKTAYPSSIVDVLASSRNHEILQLNPNVRKIRIQNRSKKNLTELKTLLDIRSEQYDIIIDLWTKISINLSIRLKLMNGKFIISPHKRTDYLQTYNLKNEDLKIYDKITGTEQIRHYSSIFHETLQPLQIPLPAKIHSDFHFSNEQDIVATNFFDSFKNSKKIGINFFAGHEWRTMDRIDVIAISNELIQKVQASHIFLIFPINVKPLAEEIKRKVNSEFIHFIPQCSILQMGAYLSKLDLIITTDTSIVHIASALNIKMVAIYSNHKKNFTEFKPLGENFQIVFSPQVERNSIKGFCTKQVIEKSIQMLVNV